MRIPFTAYVFVSVVNYLAILPWMRDELGRDVGTVATVVLAMFPLVGNVLGLLGSMEFWNWPFLRSLVIFIVLPIIIYIASSAPRAEEGRRAAGV